MGNLPPQHHFGIMLGGRVVNILLASRDRRSIRDRRQLRRCGTVQGAHPRMNVKLECLFTFLTFLFFRMRPPPHFQELRPESEEKLKMAKRKRTEAEKLKRRLNPDKARTQEQKDRAQEIRNPSLTQAQKDRAKEIRKPDPFQKEKHSIKNLQRKEKEKKEKELGEAYAQGGGSSIKLNELLEARRVLEIAQNWALKWKDFYSKNKEVIKKRQERTEQRRRKHFLKEMKQRASHADCTYGGYPRLKIGKAGKTEDDLWHEEHHVMFKQHPMEVEVYEQAKVAAAEACQSGCCQSGC